MNEIEKKEAQDKVLAMVTPIIEAIKKTIPAGLTPGQVMTILQLYFEIYQK